MKHEKSMIFAMITCFAMLLNLSGTVQAAYSASAADVVQTALSQLDYEETDSSYTKYGKWYGVPNGHWCDMFVSWCASQSGVSAKLFPQSASCTAHASRFSKMGRYHPSSARGGNYIPQQGDEIFFYDYTADPQGRTLQHTGIVLCAENGLVFTIEGNTLTNRLDYSYYEEVAPLRSDDAERLDYVAVKCYPLNAKQIHGYAQPLYQNEEPLAHDGFVDLGRYSLQKTEFDALAQSGVMKGTSSYTFSPRYGMPRGEFLDSVMRLFSLNGWDESTPAFDDVAPESPYYAAVMSARAAGIVDGCGDNTFRPDQYISGAAAQAVISRTLAYLGLADQTFEFSDGDFSYLLSPYTIRADLAHALYTLMPEAAEMNADHNTIPMVLAAF